MARLWRAAPALRSVAALVAVATCASGCSTSYQLGSLFGKSEDKPEVTGSLTPKLTSDKPAQGGLSDADLAAASAVATDVLAQDRKDASAPWENPRTGARGMITPLASSYTQDGFECRDFLASHIRGAEHAWLQGEACRVHQGKWVVKGIKPWKRG